MRATYITRVQVAAALAELVGYHAVEVSLQSKQLLGEARAGLAKMTHISHVRRGRLCFIPNTFDSSPTDHQDRTL